ncbi:MAG: TetR/AcrR family transcriptional regulator [Chloroflexi bacterium]|nr:TetR/AcrR family transcriptional regulator [Chloroflexota bacterium]
MARIVKEEDYTARRNEILDVARQLVYTKGYEQMSIQDILDALKISKGAFYHYFDSKPALLEALIDRIGEEATARFLPVMDYPSLTALEKLKNYFSGALQWKASQKDFMLALLRVWYSDDNAIIRQKVFAKMLKWVAPSFARVVRQGIAEGTLSTEFPDQATEISLHLITALGDKFGEVILGHEKDATLLSTDEKFRIMDGAVSAYRDALERVLGASTGSIELMDADSIRVWVE